MTAEIAILISLLSFGVLLLLGTYIHVALIVSGMIGIILFQGVAILQGMVAPVPYQRVATYSLSTIPMFILMAQFVLQTGAIRDLFYLVNKVAGRRKLALASLTTVSGGLLGAVSGSGMASSAALARIGVPELERAGYNKAFGSSIIAVAGALSTIVPPSVVLILYGAASGTSIGDLFIAAVVPSVLSIAAIVLAIALIGRWGAKDDHRGQVRNVIEEEAPPPIKNLVVSMTLCVVIVGVIFGGIYSGALTPTETGAIGAFAAFVGALILRKVNFRFLARAFGQTVAITGMIMLIMIGAQVFGRFVSLSMFPRYLTELLGPLMESPALVLLLICAVLFLMFMILEGAAVVLMAVPVLLPILGVLEVDLVWFGVVMALLAALGLVTPPVGINIFTVSGIVGAKSGLAFRYSSAIALIVGVLVIGLLLVFPQIALVLVE